MEWIIKNKKQVVFYSLFVLLVIAGLLFGGCSEKEKVSCDKEYASQEQIQNTLQTNYDMPSCQYVDEVECLRQKQEWVKQLQDRAESEVLNYVDITNNFDVIVRTDKLKQECKTIAKSLTSNDFRFILVDK